MSRTDVANEGQISKQIACHLEHSTSSCNLYLHYITTYYVILIVHTVPTCVLVHLVLLDHIGLLVNQMLRNCYKTGTTGASVTTSASETMVLLQGLLVLLGPLVLGDHWC